MISHLPSNVQEAFDSFKDEPSDCHNHCKCYETDGHCCDCGENRGPEEKPAQAESVPIREFLELNGERLSPDADHADVPWFDEDFVI